MASKRILKELKDLQKDPPISGSAVSGSIYSKLSVQLQVRGFLDMLQSYPAVFIYLFEEYMSLTTAWSSYMTKKKQKTQKNGRGKDWLLRKELMRRGYDLPVDAKYTGWKRKSYF